VGLFGFVHRKCEKQPSGTKDLGVCIS